MKSFVDSILMSMTGIGRFDWQLLGNGDVFWWLFKSCSNCNSLNWVYGCRVNYLMEGSVFAKIGLEDYKGLF